MLLRDQTKRDVTVMVCPKEHRWNTPTEPMKLPVLRKCVLLLVAVSFVHHTSVAHTYKHGQFFLDPTCLQLCLMVSLTTALTGEWAFTWHEEKSMLTVQTAFIL